MKALVRASNDPRDKGKRFREQEKAVIKDAITKELASPGMKQQIKEQVKKQVSAEVEKILGPDRQSQPARQADFGHL